MISSDEPRHASFGEGSDAPTTSADDTPSEAGVIDTIDERSTEQRIAAKVRQRLFSPRLGTSRIGRFQVLEELGHGSMGLVYAAYDEQLDRKVALKVLLEDVLPGEEDGLRFRREAQALARLSHPNVVAVHEVGDSGGQLFLAMEYIRGQTLDAWLSTEPEWPQILESFLQAGRGLHAAHAEGLVHRDFKPQNVMRSDGGLVKVLDFGLARVVADTLDESIEQHRISGSHEALSSSLTETGMIMGTPAYMAPEQFMGEAVVPRSDQYAFCVALWEGLTGTRPFSASSYRDLAEAKLAGPPPWPSEAPPVSRALVEALQRGLSVDPQQRWPSMEALLDQLHEPSPPRVRRWVIASVVVMAVGGAGSLAFRDYLRTESLCSGAEAKLADIWDDARQQEVRAALLSTELPYATETWEQVEPRLSAYAGAWVREHVEACEATTIRGEQSPEVMDLRLACLDERRSALRAQVEVLASADATVVENAVALAADLPKLSRCNDLEALRAVVPPPEDPKVAAEVEALRSELQELLAEQGAGRYISALEGAEEVAARAEDSGYPPVVAEASLRRGMLLSDNGRYAEAEEELLRAYTLALEYRHDEVALDAVDSLTFVVGREQARYVEGKVWAQTSIAQARRSRDDEKIAHALGSLGAVLSTEGEYEQAKLYVERALQIQEAVLPPDHPDLARSVNNLGNVLDSLGEYEQAKHQFERALELRREALGPTHPAIADHLASLGQVFHHLGEYEQAQLHFERALEIRKNALGVDHPDVANTWANLCVVLGVRGELEAARECHERALRLRLEALGPRHPDVAHSLSSLGIALSRVGEHEQAQHNFERALRLQEEVLGPEHPKIATTLTNLGAILRARGEYEQARAHQERALQILEQSLGPEHPDVANMLSNIGTILYHQAKDEEAKPYLERALRIREATLGPEHPKLSATLSTLGNVLKEQGEYEQALALHERALRIREAAKGPDSPDLGFCVNNMGTAHYDMGAYESAKTYWERALRLWEKGHGPDYVNLADPLVDLAKLAMKDGEFAVARAHAERAVSIHEAAGNDPASLAVARFVLARASWPVKSERERARRLALEARDVLAERSESGDEEHAQTLLEVERWLRGHRIR